MGDSLRQNFALMSLLVALGAGASVALVVWLVSRAVANVPPDDRAYKDPPPMGFRVLWWPIRWVSHFMRPVVSAKRQAHVLSKLRKAGLDYSLSPLQFVASRVVCGCMCGLVVYWVLGSFDSGARLSVALYGQVTLVGMLCGWVYPAIWLSDRLNARRRELLRSLPFFLDIITLCVEAGLNMQGAIHQAVLKGPRNALREELQRVLRDIRAGKGRAASLRDMADRLNESAVTSFVTTVIQAETMGMNLGPVLRAQADQRRTERFLRAEKLAMEAPVKMLLPLIAFIFPCTFIVLFFPIAMKFMHSGL
ncbi:MAG: type II secretion system F family protein [Comamonadaceae bacterium]|nr:MAG: type II secretion system F family protein [Comamonadaceae bacterium]